MSVTPFEDWARKHRPHVEEKGEYIQIHNHGDMVVQLDGHFTVADLHAVIEWMVYDYEEYVHDCAIEANDE